MILIKKAPFLCNLQYKNKNSSDLQKRFSVARSPPFNQRRTLSKCSAFPSSVFLESHWGVCFWQNKYYQFLRKRCPCSSLPPCSGETSCLFARYSSRPPPLLSSSPAPHCIARAKRIYPRKAPHTHVSHCCLERSFKCQLKVDSKEILITGK